MQHGPQHLLAKEAQNPDGLVQLAARQLARAVMQPDPRPALEPIGRGFRPGYRRRIQPGLHRLGVAREQHGRALHQPIQVAQGHELEVHVQQLRPVQADQQPGLAHMLAGKGRQQPAHPLRELEPCSHDLVVATIVADDDEIQVGILVEAAVDI